MAICLYYNARVKKRENVYFVGILKSFEHLCFDRTLESKNDPENTTFEFFVPHNHERAFLRLMDYFLQQGLVSDLKKLPNRLESGEF